MPVPELSAHPFSSTVPVPMLVLSALASAAYFLIFLIVSFNQSLH